MSHLISNGLNVFELRGDLAAERSILGIPISHSLESGDVVEGEQVELVQRAIDHLAEAVIGGSSYVLGIADGLVQAPHDLVLDFEDVTQIQSRVIMSSPPHVTIYHNDDG